MAPYEIYQRHTEEIIDKSDSIKHNFSTVGLMIDKTISAAERTPRKLANITYISFLFIMLSF